MRAIPLAAARALEPLARRTAIERTVGAGLLLALLAAVVLVARAPDLRVEPFVPKGSDGIVVLDLSASISPETFARIGTTLSDLADAGGRYGVVVFSDTAYEALPPGSPAAELRAFARYFTPRRGGFPTNPWTTAFSAGTRISSGLDLARAVAARERLRHPTIVLVSDLDDDPLDLPRLRRAALAARNAGLRIGVVGLDPSPEDVRFFQRLLERPRDLRTARAPDAHAPGGGARFPLSLVALGAALAVALAAHEVLRARLTWSGA